MDPLTHALSGLAVANAGFGQRIGRLAIWALAARSERMGLNGAVSSSTSGGVGWWTGMAPKIAAVLGLVIFLGQDPIAAGGSMGGVSGRISLAGDVPLPVRLPVTKHRSVCGDWKWSEDFGVSPVRGLANVVVIVEGAPEVRRIPEAPAVLDNVDCVFAPHVQAVAAGQVIEIRSSDRIIHTAHAYDEGGGTLFNVALPVYRRYVRRALTRPGIYRIVCDVGHTWMSAYIVVVDHPYAAVTDGSGRFQISSVPPGAYRLSFWHERLGMREEPLVIRPGSETTVSLTWRADDRAVSRSGRPFARRGEDAR